MGIGWHKSWICCILKYVFQKTCTQLDITHVQRIIVPCNWLATQLHKPHEISSIACPIQRGFKTYTQIPSSLILTTPTLAKTMVFPRVLHLIGTIFHGFFWWGPGRPLQLGEDKHSLFPTWDAWNLISSIPKHCPKHIYLSINLI